MLQPKTAILIFLQFIVPISVANASDRRSADELCKLAECRAAKEITANLNDGQKLEFVTPRTPYFLEGVGTVVLSETVSFEVVEGAEGLLEFRRVLEKTPTSITFKLDQVGFDQGKPDTMATIENNTGRFIVYGGRILRLDTFKHGWTSVCALRPGIKTFEVWEYAVGNFMFVRPRAVSEAEANKHGCQ